MLILLLALVVLAIVIVHRIQLHELLIVEHAADAEEHQRAGPGEFVAGGFEPVGGLHHGGFVGLRVVDNRLAIFQRLAAGA